MPAIMLIVPTLQRGNVVLTLQRHLERAWQRLGQPRIHRKHLVALNKTGRWSVQGRVPTLERGNDRYKDDHPGAQRGCHLGVCWRSFAHARLARTSWPDPGRGGRPRRNHPGSLCPDGNSGQAAGDDPEEDRGRPGHHAGAAQLLNVLNFLRLFDRSQERNEKWGQAPIIHTGHGPLTKTPDRFCVSSRWCVALIQKPDARASRPAFPR